MSKSEQYLEHVWVDVVNRKFQILANDGEVRDIDCSEGHRGIMEFMNVLSEIRNQVPENDVTYCTI